VDDAPRAYIEGQLRAIVGVELAITRIEAKAKLSQNRPAADVAGVIAGLRERGDTASADAVEQANASAGSRAAG
jgi:transcriptional regulator